MVVPAALFFSSPAMRKGPQASNILVYGPAHLFRSAWLAGARDYLRDPWTVEELYLRLRGPAPSFVGWSSGSQSFHLEGRRLAAESGVAVQLSSAEAALLRILVQRRGSPVSRATMAWAAGCSEGRVIDTLIGRLRQKFRLLGMGPDPLISVRGLGYRLP